MDLGGSEPKGRCRSTLNLPKYDGDHDSTDCENFPDCARPPSDAQVAPNNFTRGEADNTWSHMQRLVMGNHLVGSLSFGLIEEFDENRVERRSLASDVRTLLFLNERV